MGYPAIRVIACLLIIGTFGTPPTYAQRDDVLIIVNDNSSDSEGIGEYYASQRNINPNNIVHVRIRNSYFISWDEFRDLRDQVIHFMQKNTLDDPGLSPATCVDGDPPYYCPDSTEQLRQHTKIRYLVTTRGIPTRMIVDGSTLSFANAPTSVDNYLRYWLINYFTEDVPFQLPQRGIAFGDGRGMRGVIPAQDRELIVGRIDGLTRGAAESLVDRTLAAEAQGIYGKLYGSTGFWRLKDHSTGLQIYPDWRYVLGLFNETDQLCVDNLNHSASSLEGRTPVSCKAQISTTEDSPPGTANSRQPKVVDALVYMGWLDGSKTSDSFDSLLNWRKDASCTVTLCDQAANPAACRTASTDIFQELNTQCTGVSDGFIGYNHQSYPVSYFTIWPTGWRPDTNSGDLNQLAFSEVLTNQGHNDSFSLWFMNSDEIEQPRCYETSDYSIPPGVECRDEHIVKLAQSVTVAPETINASNPPQYRISFWHKAKQITSPTTLRATLLVEDVAGGGTPVEYGFLPVGSVSFGNTNWTYAETIIQFDPPSHLTSQFDQLTVRIDTSGPVDGELGLDEISLKRIGNNTEILQNGSFDNGHRQTAVGDHAANFLNRLNGVAFWGSLSHHQSDGCAFCFQGLETQAYFFRGLPLGDAVWFNDMRNSGILYGDPLYSPVAIRITTPDHSYTIGDSISIGGSVINGRDNTQAGSFYWVEFCAGDDFNTCDHDPIGWQWTGISGIGGFENGQLGQWDTSGLVAGKHTLRLSIYSYNNTISQQIILNDYLTVTIGIDSDGDGIIDANDNCILASNPNQQDTNSDGFGNDCDTDLDNDGFTSYSDLAIFKSNFFLKSTDSNFNPDADFNSDGIINFYDLGSIKKGFFQPSGPSGLVP